MNLYDSLQATIQRPCASNHGQAGAVTLTNANQMRKLHVMNPSFPL